MKFVACVSEEIGSSTEYESSNNENSFDYDDDSDNTTSKLKKSKTSQPNKNSTRNTFRILLGVVSSDSNQNNKDCSNGGGQYTTVDFGNNGGGSDVTISRVVRSPPKTAELSKNDNNKSVSVSASVDSISIVVPGGDVGRLKGHI